MCRNKDKHQMVLVTLWARTWRTESFHKKLIRLPGMKRFLWFWFLATVYHDTAHLLESISNLREHVKYKQFVSGITWPQLNSPTLSWGCISIKRKLIPKYRKYFFNKIYTSIFNKVAALSNAMVLVFSISVVFLALFVNNI